MSFLATQNGAFDVVLKDLTATIGRPEMSGFLKASGAASDDQFL
jgi:hypothetical protein